MRLAALFRFAKTWLRRCGEACCVGRSQAALAKTLERERPHRSA